MAENPYYVAECPYCTNNHLPFSNTGEYGIPQEVFFVQDRVIYSCEIIPVLYDVKKISPGGCTSNFLPVANTVGRGR